MKRMLAVLLCLLLVCQLAACFGREPQESVLTSFSQALKDSGYTTVTTVNPDGTTTVELVPPGTTTLPSSATTAQSTTAPTTGTSTQSSVQPTTVPGGTTTAGTGTTGQFATTVTVPMGTTEPEVLKLTRNDLLLTTIGATWNLSDGTIAPVLIRWESENEKVATVKNGIVTTTGFGTTYITATYKGQVAKCRVIVQMPTTEPPYFLSLKYKTLTMNAGTSMSIYSGDIPQNELTWTSSDTRIATVTNGTVVARQAGTAVITARYQNQTASCTVTVQQVTTDPTTEPDGVISLTHSTLTLLVGGTMNIYNGTIPAAQVTWTTTNSQIVSVNNGVITALRAGNAVVKASYGSKSAMCTITVQQVTTDPTTATTTKPTTQSTTVTTAATSTGHVKLTYTQRYLYNLLSSQEKEWYRKIDTAVNSLETEISTGVNLGQNERYYIYFYYMFDNPEHFYLGSQLSYSSNGRLLFSYSDGTTNYIPNTDDVFTDAMRANIRARKATFDAEVKRIIAAIPVTLPDVEKELMIYERLIIDMRYNLDAVNNNLWDGVAQENWTAYGGIINKTGVCEAYAEAFQTLCYAVGINCTGVVGKANGGGHKWNAVELDGEWYICDVTWDDPIGMGDGVVRFHDYFNITTAQLLAGGHTMDGSRYPGPTCTATKYSYQNYFG